MDFHEKLYFLGLRAALRNTQWPWDVFLEKFMYRNWLLHISICIFCIFCTFCILLHISAYFELKYADFTPFLNMKFARTINRLWGGSTSLKSSQPRRGPGRRQFFNYCFNRNSNSAKHWLFCIFAEYAPKISPKICRICKICKITCVCRYFSSAWSSNSIIASGPALGEAVNFLGMSIRLTGDL